MNKFNPFALGLALGILWAAGLFFMALFSMFFGLGKEWVDLIGKVYLGTASTWIGAFIGSAWAFVDAFIGGLILAWLYNFFNRRASL